MALFKMNKDSILKGYIEQDLDSYIFYYKNSANLLLNLLKVILTELKKYSKRLENINSKLDECKNMDQYNLYGELLTSNLYRLR